MSLADAQSFQVNEMIDSLRFISEKWFHARRVYHARLAPDFILFDFMSTDEVGLSGLIAFLLNPRGTHAQGSRFLAVFLRHMAEGTGPAEAQHFVWPKEALENAEVTVERPARMDIAVFSNDARGNRYGFAIENKLRGAMDQDTQISRYFAALKAGRAQFPAVVYLTTTGYDPSVQSVAGIERLELAKNLSLQNWEAARLRSWLNECRSITEAETVRHFVEAFIAFLDKEIIQVIDQNEGNEMVSYILEDPKRVEALLNSAKLVGTVKAELATKLNLDVPEALQKYGLSLDPSTKLVVGKQYCGYVITRDGSDLRHSVCFEFQSGNLNYLVYGVLVPSTLETVRSKDPARAALISAVGPAGLGGGDEWIWVRVTGDGYSDIPTDWSAGEVWRSIADGSMAPKIAKCADRILTIVENAHRATAVA